MIAPLVEAALREDLGDAGDITSALTIPAETRGRARIVAREAGRLCGLACARLAFRALDASLTVRERLPDGAETAGGALIAEIEGPARAILSAERVALNFIGQLSGIATATDALVRAVAGTKARIVCTRKTTPGLRILEKYAVRCGGGLNHRFGLYDAVLIKDNHIAAAGGVAAALGAAKAGAGHLVKIEIEVDTLAQLEEALAAGADAVLLDNMTPDQLREAVRLTAGRAVLEASGNVRADTVRAIAETGVDVISSGAITHSRRVLDIGLDWV
ncbi:MAG: carboxylating nicotinate-nucleotide diphosphorylase [Alphaproteobacteria bacterium]|nr:carboxylating nicotinate-nucleotide diphosphorylase [Alphaproteobacteria bacterium]